MKTIQRRRGETGPILETTSISEKQHSIEVSKTAKGDITYSIKLYFEDADDLSVVDKVKAIRDQIIGQFTEAEK